MHVITAPHYPNPLERQPDVSVFLAGGITGCPDWQSDVIRYLLDSKHVQHRSVALMNPRRQSFPIEDPTAAEKQIAWEFHMLEKADIIFFWFAAEGIQPIVMYEYGRWLALGKKLVVGVEPGFWRERDVYIQTRLASGGAQIIHSILRVATGALMAAIEERLMEVAGL